MKPINYSNISSINFMKMRVGDFPYSNTCPNCHKPYMDMGESSVPMDTCKCYVYPKDSPILMGWKCPCCGGGVAPGVERCPCTPILFSHETIAGNLIINSQNDSLDEDAINK